MRDDEKTRGANPMTDKPSAEAQCTWAQLDADDDDCGLWHTDCKNEACLSKGTPLSNKYKFCPYCGKPITEKCYTYPDEEADDE